MTDYSPLLRKAIADLDRPDEAARYDVYERVRQALVHQLQAAGRPDADFDKELDTLRSAVAHVENEIARQRTPHTPVPPSIVRDDFGEPEADTPRVAAGPLSQRWVGIAAAAIVAAAVAGLSVYYFGSGPRREPTPVSRAEPAKTAPRAAAANSESSGEETGSSYVLRRQRIFYRTTHPPGTIIVSLQQRFLYLVQPNQVAIRYAIGVGPACENAVGLFHVTEKVARPDGAASAMDTANQSAPRFGPPALYFDQGRAVHEATEPKRIGQSATVGCFQSWDQDIADLFERISLNERVVVAN